MSTGEAAVKKDVVTALELLSITGSLNTAVDLDFLLKQIGDAAERLLDSEASAIMLLTRDGRSLTFKVASGEKGRVLETMVLPVGKGIAGWVAQTRQAELVNDARSDPHFAAEFDKASGFDTRSALCVPMLCRGELIGVLEVVNRREGPYQKEHIELLSRLAAFAAGVIDNARTLAEQKGFFSHILEVLTIGIEGSMPGMGGHATRAATLARSIGRSLEMGDYELKMLYYAGLLHDIGYLAFTNRDYLASMGVTKVTEELHPVLSARLLEGITMIEGAIPMVAAHHERFDGSGFPDGLKGAAIPLGARILCLVEAVEEIRMTGLRGQDLYRKAAAEAKAGAGKSFDPQVAAAFIALIEARTTSW